MSQFINQGFNDNIGLPGGDVVQGPIPLYQNGFNWLRFWLGCCLTLTLCILLATFITFLVLFTLTITGSIASGRMIKPTEVELTENRQTLKSFVPALINDIKGFSEPFVKPTKQNTVTLANSKVEKNGIGNKLLKNLIPAV